MGGGESSGTSRPLSAGERQDIYTSAIQNLKNTDQSIMPQGYVAPSFASAGPAKTINGGDYDKLQADMTAGYTAPIQQAKETDLRNYNSDAAKRGVWSSGLALQGENDINKAYAPQFANAGAQATNARYALQSGEDQNQNQYNLQQSGAQNTFGLANAQQNYQSNWAPLNYLQGVWNGTGGTIGSSSSMNMNF